MISEKCDYNEFREKSKELGRADLSRRIEQECNAAEACARKIKGSRSQQEQFGRPYRRYVELLEILASRVNGYCDESEFALNEK